MSSNLSSDIPIGTKVILHSLKTTKYNGLFATVTASYVDNTVLYYTMDCATLPKTFDVKREKFDVVELPAPPAAAASTNDEDNYYFVDESECLECGNCLHCTDNIIQTDKGSELCCHDCNCHLSKRQLSEWYSAAVDDNKLLVAANTAFFQANTELIASNKALVDANLALQKQIEELKSQLENATTK